MAATSTLPTDLRQGRRRYAMRSQCPVASRWSPGAVLVDGGGAWQSTGKFHVRWTNPEQVASPIVAAEYSLCPESNAAGAMVVGIRCTQGGAASYLYPQAR